ncbi:IS1 family transposase [Oculatella sp. LEGE 06141]|nr:IS1 family transposase [Oculatella sp. LEGE 06141]
MVLPQYTLKTKHLLMKCPTCGSEQFQRNGHRRGRQNYRCKNCGRQYIEAYVVRGYSEDTRQLCIKMYSAGLGLREMERLTGISHSTLYNWIKQSGLFSSEETSSNDTDSGH